MNEADRTRVRGELERFFGDGGSVSEKVLPDGTVLFKVEKVRPPRGCSPDRVNALLAYPPGAGTPKVAVSQGLRLPNGATPTSTSNTLIDGEPWMDFSANYPYNPSESAALYILGKLNRFARPP